MSINFAAIFTHAVIIIGLQSVYSFFFSNGSWINNPMHLVKNDDVLPSESYILVCNCCNRNCSISTSKALLWNTCHELIYCNCYCSDRIHFSYMSVALQDAHVVLRIRTMSEIKLKPKACRKHHILYTSIITLFFPQIFRMYLHVIQNSFLTRVYVYHVGFYVRFRTNAPVNTHSRGAVTNLV